MYHVIRDHVPEQALTISFRAGDVLAVGEKYDGPEGWNDWYYCEVEGCPGGWVPEQVFVRTGQGTAVAREDYTARELETRAGDQLAGTRRLNGWVWCQSVDGAVSGWVPEANLRPLDPGAAAGPAPVSLYNK